MLSRAVRRLGRWVIAPPLVILYVIGVIAAVVVIVCVTSAAAIRLGWSDTRKRATDGAA